MSPVIEIFAVIAAFLCLVWSGLSLVRSVKRFGRTVKMTQSHDEPKMMALMAESDMVQRRVFTITGNADIRQRNVESVRMSTGKLMVIINAFREASESISRLQDKLGF